MRLMILVGLTLAIQSVGAGAEVSLPLVGHYRPGKFIPIRVTHGGTGEIRISAPGCVTTVIENPGETEVVAPFLAVSDSLTTVQVTNAPPAGMKPVGEGQRLIVTADAD